MKTGKNLGHVTHAISPAYQAQLAAVNESGQCPFCADKIFTLKNPPIEPALWEHWWLKRNDFPYPHHSDHFVVVLKKHRVNLCDVTPEESAEIVKILQWVEQTYDIHGGMFCMRFGAFEFSGATIAHIHGQIQVPDQTGPAVATVFLPERLRARLRQKQSIFVD